MDEDTLRRLFPSVRWEDVRWHRGLPPLVRRRGVRAMVLPCAWHPRRVHVHLGEADLATPGGRALLVHECIHVRQYGDLGAGLGYLRPFVVAYLAWVPWRGTTRAHPLEAPAYAERMGPTEPFWRILAGPPGWGRALLPLRLAVGVVGALLAALVAGPLVELLTGPAAPPPRAGGPAPRPPPPSR